MEDGVQRRPPASALAAGAPTRKRSTEKCNHRPMERQTRRRGHAPTVNILAPAIISANFIFLNCNILLQLHTRHAHDRAAGQRVGRAGVVTVVCPPRCGARWRIFGMCKLLCPDSTRSSEPSHARQHVGALAAPKWYRFLQFPTPSVAPCASACRLAVSSLLLAVCAGGFSSSHASPKTRALFSRGCVRGSTPLPLVAGSRGGCAAAAARRPAARRMRAARR